MYCMLNIVLILSTLVFPQLFLIAIWHGASWISTFERLTFDYLLIGCEINGHIESGALLLDCSVTDTSPNGRLAVISEQPTSGIFEFSACDHHWRAIIVSRHVSSPFNITIILLW